MGRSWRALAAGGVLAASTVVAAAHVLGPSATAGASQVGSWASAVSLPSNVVGVHATVLRTGKVLLLTGFNGVPAGYLFDPSSNSGKVINPPDNVFCGGQTFLNDGTVLFAGGLAAPAPAPAAGIPATDTFDPVSETWTKGPNMANGRWYPTETRLTDGSILITAGRSQNASVNNYQVELYKGGSISLFGPNETLFPYPHQFVLPNGKIFATDNSRTAIFDSSSKTWASLATHLNTQGRPGAVLLPGGPGGSTKIMLFGGEAGGTANALANTEVFDTANPGAGWVPKASIPQPRNDMNTVLLPDGTILAVGGNGSGDYSQPQLQTLLYNPATDTWTPLASQAYQRAYHSTAVLLPDGRVLSAGDTSGAPGNHSLEIYSPPYLFQGARPSITSAPGSVGWGQTFNIGTSGSVARAVLMSPGATTHNDDMNQRHIELAITQSGNGVTATAPATNLAPPGWYMLFVLDGNNVPSVAKWIQVGGSSQGTAPDPPTNVTATAGNGQATVSWTPPANTGGSAINQYTVTTTGGGPTVQVDGSTTSAVVNGLTNGNSYTFTVTATNSTGTSQPSALSNSVTPTATVPGAPTGVTATPGDSQATVQWTAPTDPGGSPISGYTVTASPGGATATVNGSPPATQATVSGLTNGTSYTFTVTATNSFGNGPASAASSPVTPGVAPVWPTNVTATAGWQEAHVSWTAPANTGGSPITKYTVITSPPDVPPIDTPDGNTTSLSVPGLTNTTTYTFTVTATNALGTSIPSSPSPGVTPGPSPPDPPTGVQATAGDSQATVQWTAPTNTGGSPITSYTVTASPGGATATTPDGTTTSLPVPGLTNGINYTFTVTATNVNGPSLPSAPSNQVTPHPASTVPGAPVAVTAKAGAGQIGKISWSAPASNGGSPITGYTVTSSPGNIQVTVGGSTLTATITGLKAHVTYTFTVVATNANGPGPPSAPSNSIVPR